MSVKSRVCDGYYESGGCSIRKSKTNTLYIETPTLSPRKIKVPWGYTFRLSNIIVHINITPFGKAVRRWTPSKTHATPRGKKS